jgi:hypothetical protein
MFFIFVAIAVQYSDSALSEQLGRNEQQPMSHKDFSTTLQAHVPYDQFCAVLQGNSHQGSCSYSRIIYLLDLAGAWLANLAAFTSLINRMPTVVFRPPGWAVSTSAIPVCPKYPTPYEYCSIFEGWDAFRPPPSDYALLQ